MRAACRFLRICVLRCIPECHSHVVCCIPPSPPYSRILMSSSAMRAPHGNANIATRKYCKLLKSFTLSASPFLSYMRTRSLLPQTMNRIHKPFRNSRFSCFSLNTHTHTHGMVCVSSTTTIACFVVYFLHTYPLLSRTLALSSSFLSHRLH